MSAHPLNHQGGCVQGRVKEEVNLLHGDMRLGKSEEKKKGENEERKKGNIDDWRDVLHALTQLVGGLQRMQFGNQCFFGNGSFFWFFRLFLQTVLQ